MKRKLHFLLAAIAALMFALPSMADDYTGANPPTEGKGYYLYNTGTQKFLTTNNSVTDNITEAALWTATSSSTGTWNENGNRQKVTLKSGVNYLYLKKDGNTRTATTNGTIELNTINVSYSETGYSIGIGSSGSYTYLSANTSDGTIAGVSRTTSGNSRWLFISPQEYLNVNADLSGTFVAADDYVVIGTISIADYTSVICDILGCTQDDFTNSEKWQKYEEEFKIFYERKKKL